MIKLKRLAVFLSALLGVGLSCSSAQAATVLFQDTLRGPTGSYVSAWGADLVGRPVECVNASCVVVVPAQPDPRLPAHGHSPQLDKISLRVSGQPGQEVTIRIGGSSVRYTLTAGQAKEVRPNEDAPGAVRLAKSGDQIILRAGLYPVIEFRGKQGVSLTCFPGEVCQVLGISAIRATSTTAACIDCSVSNLLSAPSSSGVWMHFGRAGSKAGLRVVGNHAQNLGGSSSGALITISRADNTVILGNSTRGTGVLGSNQAQDIYFGGSAANTGLEIAYNELVNHLGGRHIQIYGHTCGERLSGLAIHHNHVWNETGWSGGGNAGILVSHSDCAAGKNQRGDGWIVDAIVHDNTVHGISSGDGIRYETSDLATEPGTFATSARNVIFDVGGASIETAFAQGHVSEGNCLGKAPVWNPAYKVAPGGPYSSTNDRVDYPVCLTQPVNDPPLGEPCE